MKRNRSAQMWVLLFGAAVCAPALSVRAAEQPDFSLTRVVPQDVFLCVSGRHNPEQAFVEKYWGDVFAAAKECGIGEDFMGLLGSMMGSEQMDEVNRLKARAQELFANIDWSALGDGEMVFAERWMGMAATEGNLHIGPPDILIVFRGEKAAQNYEGLVALVSAALDEIHKAAGPESAAIKLLQDEVNGTRIARIPLITQEAHGLNYTVALAQRDDVVMITIGDKILDDTLALQGAGAKAGASLADSPRYQQAFNALPAAEDAKVFFDVQAMLMPIRSVINVAMSASNNAEDRFLNAQESGDAFDLNEQALAAYRSGDQAKALELVKQAAEKDPKDSRILYNLACFNAINGNKDAALTALTQAVEAGCHAPGLIATDSDLATLRDAPAYEQALAKAKEAASSANAGADQGPRQLVDRLLNIPGMFDYVATVGYTNGYSVHSETHVQLMEGAKDNPFYPVISGKSQLGSFDKYLPKETESFSIAGGFDIGALYTFVKDSFTAAGRDGVEAWGEWEQWQKDAEFDVHENVLNWLGSEMMTITLAGQQGGVLMVKVQDEAVAREKVGAAVDFLSTKLVEAAASNPALTMFAVRKSPVQNPKLEGFQNLFFGMSPQPVVWGVADGHLIFSNKAEAIVTCLDTAKGAHPNVRENAQVMSEALVPQGDYVSMTLTDQRNLGQELAAGIGMFSMMSGFASMAIPDEAARQMIGQIAGMLMKLSPVVSKIDFFKSIASVTTFDGTSWHTHAVTHYVAPEERTASAQ